MSAAPSSVSPSAAADAPALLCSRDGPVLRLTISNPGARNALAPEMYAAGERSLREAAADASVRAVVLAGDGDTFCAGGNLQRLQANRARPPQVQRDSIDALHRWVRALRACPVPVIAAVEGPAAGAGFSLVLACDLVVAAENARFVMAYVKVGLSPDGGATHALARRVPYATAFEWLATGAPIDAATLHRHGLVNRVVAPGTAVAAALEWARALAQGPADALARIKALASAAEAAALDAQLDAEREAFVASLHGPEAAEGIDAFLARRPPAFGPASR